MYCIDDAVFFIQCKYQHRHLLFHTHDRCCQIHSCQFLCNYFFNGNFIIFYCIRVCLRITVINSVNSFCKKDCFCFDFYCAKYSGCICGEVRMSSEGSFSPGRIAPDIISLLSCSISEKYFGFPLSVMSSSLLYLGYNLYARTNKLFFMHKLYKISRDFSLVFSKTPRGIVICEQ